MFKIGKPKFLMSFNEKFLLDDGQKALKVNFKIKEPVTLNYTDPEGHIQTVKVSATAGNVGVVRVGDADKYTGKVNVPAGAKINYIKEDGSLDYTEEVVEPFEVEAFLSVNEMVTLVRTGAIEIVNLA